MKIKLTLSNIDLFFYSLTFLFICTMKNVGKQTKENVMMFLFTLFVNVNLCFCRKLECINSTQVHDLTEQRVRHLRPQHRAFTYLGQ